VVLGFLVLEQVGARGPHHGILLENASDGLSQICRVLIWNGRVDALEDFVAELAHTLGPEGRVVSAHLIQDTAHTPHV